MAALELLARQGTAPAPNDERWAYELAGRLVGEDGDKARVHINTRMYVAVAELDAPVTWAAVASDLCAELHRPEHSGRFEVGPLVVFADDEGLIHFTMKGPWSAAVRRGFAWN